MKKAYILILLLALSKPIFAQTDYTFVVERSSEISIFQFLATALVTDIDTISAVSFSDRAAYLFSPLPGNTPELIRIVSEKVHSDPLRGRNGTPTGISAAITTANEQAKAYERSGASRKMIIITSALRTDGTTNLSLPTDAFTDIYYLSFDMSLDQVQAIVDITNKDADGNNYAWAINFVLQNHDFLLLADGLYICVNAIIPDRYKVDANHDILNFKVGNFFQQVSRVIVLAVKNSNDDAFLYKSGTNVPVPILDIPQVIYSILSPKYPSNGNFSITNGEIVLVMFSDAPSFFARFIICLIILVVFIFLVHKINKRIKKDIVSKACQFIVKWEKDNKDGGGFQPSVYIKRNKKNDDFADSFESGVRIYEIIQKMSLDKAMLNEKIVTNSFPYLDYVKSEKTWYIKYNPNLVNTNPLNIQADAPKRKFDPDNPSYVDVSPNKSEVQPEYDKECKVDFIKNVFEVKYVFKDECYKLILEKQS